jgi:hypothetical protein
MSLPPPVPAAAAETLPPFESVLGPYVEYQRKFFSVSELALLLHRGRDFVEGLIECGELDAHSAGPGRKIDRKRITLASVARYLAASALYEERDSEARTRDLFAAWTPAQRRWAIGELTRLADTPPRPLHTFRRRKASFTRHE